MNTSLISYFLFGEEIPVTGYFAVHQGAELLTHNHFELWSHCVYTCIFERVHFSLLFQQKMLFQPKCNDLFLAASIVFFQQLHVGQKCVHIYVSEIAFLPD